MTKIYPEQLSPGDLTITTLLSEAGVRPTKQRIAIAAWLFGSTKHWHFTAESLHQILHHHDIHLPLATVYNTLNTFERCGLIRKICVSPSIAVYDTNTAPHHHLVVGDMEEIRDISYDEISLAALPELPAELQLRSVEVTLRARTTASLSQS